MLDDNVTFYEILDISPDANPQELRDAYLRVKSTYSRDNVALYTLISTEERELALRQIEEAYLVLSDPMKRSLYDQNHGLRVTPENPFSPPDQTQSNNKVVSIDRVPPMETGGDSDSMLIPPTTDFTHASSSEKAPLAAKAKESENPFAPSPVETEHQELRSDYIAIRVHPKSSDSTTRNANSRSKSKSGQAKNQIPTLDPALARAVEDETEWSGIFIKKIREAYHISLEEMASTTKVSKTYIAALEEENFERLPATVYIRGFITQIAKVLRLRHEKVATAYIARYNRAIHK
jgi:curved DNA-binding protein CbpA